MTELVEGAHDYSEAYHDKNTTRMERAAIIKDLLSSSRTSAKGIVFAAEDEDGNENELYKSLMERGQKVKQVKILSHHKGQVLPEDNLLYKQRALYLIVYNLSILLLLLMN